MFVRPVNGVCASYFREQPTRLRILEVKVLCRQLPDL
jgi:hypothetical protein